MHNIHYFQFDTFINSDSMFVRLEGGQDGERSQNSNSRVSELAGGATV